MVLHLRHQRNERGSFVAGWLLPYSQRVWPGVIPGTKGRAQSGWKPTCHPHGWPQNYALMRVSRGRVPQVEQL